MTQLDTDAVESLWNIHEEINKKYVKHIGNDKVIRGLLKAEQVIEKTIVDIERKYRS